MKYLNSNFSVSQDLPEIAYKRTFRALDEIEAILLKHDPLKRATQARSYQDEALAVCDLLDPARRRTLTGAAIVEALTGSDSQKKKVGEESRWDAIAREIWQMWKKRA